MRLSFQVLVTGASLFVIAAPLRKLNEGPLHEVLFFSCKDNLWSGELIQIRLVPTT